MECSCDDSLCLTVAFYQNTRNTKVVKTLYSCFYSILGLKQLSTREPSESHSKSHSWRWEQYPNLSAVRSTVQKYSCKSLPWDCVFLLNLFSLVAFCPLALYGYPVLWRNVIPQMHCSGLAWHPDVATQMVLASEDDRLPVIQMWDLRFTSSPLRVLESHTRYKTPATCCSVMFTLLMTIAVSTSHFLCSSLPMLA